MHMTIYSCQKNIAKLWTWRSFRTPHFGKHYHFSFDLITGVTPSYRHQAGNTDYRSFIKIRIWLAILISTVDQKKLILHSNKKCLPNSVPLSYSFLIGLLLQKIGSQFLISFFSWEPHAKLNVPHWDLFCVTIAFLISLIRFQNPISKSFNWIQSNV